MLFALLALFYCGPLAAQVVVQSDGIQIAIDPAGNVTVDDRHAALTIGELTVEPAGDHVWQVRLRLDNVSSDPVALPLGLGLAVGGDIAPVTDPGGGFGASFYAWLRPFILTDTELRFPSEEEPPEVISLTDGSWLGVINRFTVAALQVEGDNWSLQPGIANDGAASFPVAAHMPPTIDAAASLTLQFRYLQGPRQQHILQAADQRLEALLLPGMWAPFRTLCFWIWDLLGFFQVLTGNWGLATILLALVVRLFTIPITRKSLDAQARAADQHARLAPMIKQLKERYSGVEQSEKLIALYEEQHYDHLLPFKGMLGLFIQIPIFIAVFNVLGEIAELRGASFLWIDDLALSDRLFALGFSLPWFGGYFNLLPFIMALVTVLSSWMASRNSQATTMGLFGMAALFFVLFYSFPAAMVLYWTCSNLFQLLQQLVEAWRSR